MLPKENRLKKRKDFERVLTKGEIKGNDLLVLKKIENGLQVSRFGFIVSRKISNKAVVRNKIKRRLREIVRVFLKEKRIMSGYDVVVFAKKGIEKQDFWVIKEKTKDLLKKGGIFE